MPSFLLNGRFFARFRDEDTVLVLQLATIFDRDVLMQIDPRAFFFTEHYRDYPAVLIRLAEVPRQLLADVLRDSWGHLAALPPARPRRKRPSSRQSSPSGARKAERRGDGQRRRGPRREPPGAL
jgi:hypothetical protein